MESLYEVAEYSGKLPNPKLFPVEGIVLAVKDKLYMFSDVFMFDLFVREADRKRLENKVFRTTTGESIDSIIEDAEKSEILLSEPEYIYAITYLTYIVFTPDGGPVAMQVKYYKYFRNRYKRCQFYNKGFGTGLIAVKVDNKLVGVCMPVFLLTSSIAKIKEERK